MSEWQKIGIGVGAALLIGFIGGYLLGSSGKSTLRLRADRAQKELAALKGRVADEEADASNARSKTKLTLGLLRAKEQLFRAAVQLNANNFGIASQRLGAANVQLKKASETAAPSAKKRISAIMVDIGNAHTLSMRLDPTARVHLERIVELVHRLPGAR